MIRTSARWLAMALLFVGSRAAAQTPQGAVGKVPADAMFFTSGQRLGEQFDIFYKSNAYAKLRALPAVKLLHQQLMQEAHKANNPIGHVMEIFSKPEMADLRHVLIDLFRNEIFAYGGQDTMKFLQI